MLLPVIEISNKQHIYILVSFFTFLLFGGILGGHYGDRNGRKNSIIFSLLCNSICNILSTFIIPKEQFILFLILRSPAIVFL